MNRTIIKKKKGKRYLISIGQVVLIILIIALIFLLKHIFQEKYSKTRKNNPTQGFTFTDNNADEKTEKTQNTKLFEKPESRSVNDRLNLNLNSNEELSLIEYFKERDEFLKAVRELYFGKIGCLTLGEIYLQLVYFLKGESDETLTDLYVFQFPVLNFIIPKINWTKENCNSFSLELKWIVNICNKKSLTPYWVFRDILDAILEVFGVKIPRSKTLNCWDVSKVEDTRCFDIYKQDLATILEHVLTNCRILLGRPVTLKIIDIIWDNMPIQDNLYVKDYRKIMMEAVGLEPLLC